MTRIKAQFLNFQWVRLDRSEPLVCRIDVSQASSIKAKARSMSLEAAAMNLLVI